MKRLYSTVNETPMVNLFNSLRLEGDVTRVVDVGRPITPQGVVKAGFTDSITFMPKQGTSVFLTNACDAGREVKAEKRRISSNRAAFSAP
jgi:hypothetical protein